MFDVFYKGPKPNLFAFERPAESLEDAAQQSRTLYYWFIYSGYDHTLIDFDYVPVPWESTHIHVWPSQFYEYGGVYLANKHTTHEYKWQFHDKIVKTVATKRNWTILHPVHEDRFDWSWVPHPKDPPYIYVFGNQWHGPEHMPTVEYAVPGATERKYMDIVATLAPDTTNWTILQSLDPSSIDYSWKPNPMDPPYIYEFGTQWQPNGGATYTVPGVVERKYIDRAHRRLANKDNWENLEIINNFDYSWHPDNTEEPYIYIFGNQHWSGTIMPTVKYTVPGATQEKFVDLPIAKLAESKANWEILESIDESCWDWTWRPNPLDPPLIYAFGNQWNPPEYKVSIRYVVPGATEVKYMETRTHRMPAPESFTVNIPIDEFDFSWEPNPFDPPMDYVFGNQWNPAVIEPTVIYHVAGATETKYIDEVVATVSADMLYWELLDQIESFDYTWRPNPKDPPYTYVFGNQWLTPEQRPALQYQVPGAVQIKYMDEPKAQRMGNPKKFKVNYECEFDHSWEPDPHSPPYHYIFGNQHWPANIMPTVEYIATGATEIKYLDAPYATLSPHTNWVLPTDYPAEFDRSWRPEPGSPALIYVFGNQWYPATVMPTVEYHMAGAVERKYMDNITAKLLPVMDRWHIPEEVDQNNIDFSWCPHPKDIPYIYHFGTEHQMSVGLTYTVPGATELKFQGEVPRISQEQKVVKALEIFFIDRNNVKAQTRFENLSVNYQVTKVRYVNSLIETIQRCINRAQGNKFWIVSSEYNYDNFNFHWHAEPWQSYMTHVFPSQHNKWSDTFLINRWEFERHAKWAASLEQFPNLNFVQDQTVDKPEVTADIYYVDHGNPESEDNYNYFRVAVGETIRTRFIGEYLDVMKRIVNTAETEYVWIVSSLCKYNDFDFTWEPEPWQREMIHCWPSGSQRRGDTFYIHVESFKAQMVELELLDWFNVINYVEDFYIVDRYPTPVHYYQGDDLISEIKNYDFKTPYVTFTNQQDLSLTQGNCLWSKKDRTVVRASRSGATCLVPRDVKQHLKTQMYDYPYLDKYFFINEYYDKKTFPGIDIVYISNGEPDEEKWYDTLCYRANLMSKEITWIRGVDGRTAAYQAAARASTTPWFFAVFAKLEVDYAFPWREWMPDYWQEPKHYIFNALNPVNGLEYGHQGVIAYNKQLVLENNTPGIDFTLSQPHESVPILSGTAHFNQDPWMTWRTAFREVIKLKHFDATAPTLENSMRLETWCTRAQGQYAKYCLQGAQDAVAYYTEVAGDYEKLKLSFEWAWLRKRFNESILE